MTMVQLKTVTFADLVNHPHLEWDDGHGRQRVWHDLQRAVENRRVQDQMVEVLFAARVNDRRGRDGQRLCNHRLGCLLVNVRRRAIELQCLSQLRQKLIFRFLQNPVGSGTIDDCNNTTSTCSGLSNFTTICTSRR